MSATENETGQVEHIISLSINETMRKAIVKAKATESMETGITLSRSQWIRNAINYYLERGENVK